MAEVCVDAMVHVFTDGVVYTDVNGVAHVGVYVEVIAIYDGP